MILRKFDKKSELKIQRALFEECFPENIGTPVLKETHYNWKFHSKTGKNKSAEFVSCDGDDMLGYYAAIPYYYKYGGKILTAAMVCDVMTGINARGKGVFTKLGIYSTEEMAKLGFDITTGYPIRSEVIPGHIKAGWLKCFELPLFGRFVKFNSFLKKKKLLFFAPILNSLLSLINVISKIAALFIPKGISLNLTTSEDPSVFSELQKFYENWVNEINIGLIKDEEFLKWRLGAPEKKYHIITLRSEEKTVGVLIAREVVKEGVPCIGILDLAILKDYQKYSRLIINKLHDLSNKIGSELILIMIGKKWYKKYNLFQNSFLKTPYKFFLIIKTLNSEFDTNILKKEENWHLMWIDSDDL